MLSTFEAYQIVREGGLSKLRHPGLAQNGNPLMMRLMINDVVRLEVTGSVRTMRVTNISGNGQVFMADLHEANVDARNRDRNSDFKYISKMAGSFQSAKARQATVSAIGDLREGTP